MHSLKREESVNFFSHLIGALFMPVGTFLLIQGSAKDLLSVVTLLIYGISVTLLFSASSLYHYMKKEENEKSIWRTLDHVSIFFMIAGTYTPITAMVLDGPWRVSILAVQWGLVALGLVQKLIWLRAPRWLTTAIYLAMGWIAIVALKPLYDHTSMELILLLFGGGVLYSIGAVIYAMKKPNPFPGFFGFHEIFHIFILAATVVLYILVYRIVTGLF
ncbi:MAG: hemolysin III family protein [Spirochaetales bacterium]|nr:hemolysin III family protein [Spirochaetales bacterium]